MGASCHPLAALLLCVRPHGVVCVAEQSPEGAGGETHGLEEIGALLAILGAQAAQQTSDREALPAGRLGAEAAEEDVPALFNALHLVQKGQFAQRVEAALAFS